LQEQWQELLAPNVWNHFQEGLQCLHLVEEGNFGGGVLDRSRVRECEAQQGKQAGVVMWLIDEWEQSSPDVQHVREECEVSHGVVRLPIPVVDEVKLLVLLDLRSVAAGYHE
jgi:hypothetical protein